MTEHFAASSLDIDADPADLWDALTTPEGLAPWMGDGASIDARPDGAVAAPDIATGTPRRGRVERLVPGRSLEFAWWPEDDPDQVSSVAIELQEIDTGTRIVIVERPASAAGTVEASAAWAWRSALLSVSRSCIRL